ncbi:MAG TPA: DUF480 domain-containing protein [Mycobacteriales bacterium]|nr:DUF480 domain-containing protein [Mycobacteriales bacterium]
MELTFAEGRVLGCLVEKRLLTPQQYPLSDNALLTACNQTTSRDPVVAYDVPTVRLAVRSLRERGLVRTVHRTGDRADKHEHRMDDVLALSPAEVALLAVLLLRGPQTPGELRARTDRMHAFATTEEVERVLDGLAARVEPLAVRLERQPGRKEHRYADALVERSATPAPAPDEPPGEAAPSLREEVAALRAEVAALRAEVAALRGGSAAAADDDGAGVAEVGL